MIQPLDLRTILVGYLAGGGTIFLFLALIFFAWVSARYRMPSAVYLVLMGLFIILFPVEFNIFYTLVIFLAAFFFYLMLSRVMKT